MELTSLASLVASVVPESPLSLVALDSPLASPAAGGLAAAFALGLVHALDADHVMALSVLATRGRSAADGLRAGLRWSLGHGVVVLVLGVAVLALGSALPAWLGSGAERVVGLVMIALGVRVWIELLRRRAHLHFHAHDDLPPHAHWHAHSRVRNVHDHDHEPLLVGGLHGLAGAAPLFAVLGLAAGSPLLAVASLVTFGLGVSAAMLVVSGLLGYLSGRRGVGARGVGVGWLRGVAGSGSIALGVWLCRVGA